MNINTMMFVAPNLACGEARGGRIPQSGAVTDEQRRHRPNSAQPSGRAAVLFRPDFVPRFSQIHCGICSSLAPSLAEKSLTANVIVFMFMTTKGGTPNFCAVFIARSSGFSRFLARRRTFATSFSYSQSENHLFSPLCREPLSNTLSNHAVSGHSRQSRPTKCTTKFPARPSWDKLYLAVLRRLETHALPTPSQNRSIRHAFALRLVRN